ncbi:unnamed protein product [Moneuplotes crassus]|uniref:Calmodulin n=1 Tax=Euplotes crassus TaxID=5936 RepID=A0AAD1X953_EUPCR|nr:unnamed protein product [Moneuplotes crassus]
MIDFHNQDGESYYEEEEEESEYENESTIISNNSRLVGIKPKAQANDDVPSPKAKKDEEDKEDHKKDPDEDSVYEEEESEYETETITNSSVDKPAKLFQGKGKEELKKKKLEEIKKKKEELQKKRLEMEKEKKQQKEGESSEGEYESEEEESDNKTTSEQYSQFMNTLKKEGPVVVGFNSEKSDNKDESMSSLGREIDPKESPQEDKVLKFTPLEPKKEQSPKEEQKAKPIVYTELNEPKADPKPDLQQEVLKDPPKPASPQKPKLDIISYQAPEPNNNQDEEEEEESEMTYLTESSKNKGNFVLGFQKAAQPAEAPKEEEKKVTSGSEKPKLSEWDSTTSNKPSDAQTGFKLGNLKMKTDDREGVKVIRGTKPEQKPQPQTLKEENKQESPEKASELDSPENLKEAELPPDMKPDPKEIEKGDEPIRPKRQETIEIEAESSQKKSKQASNSKEIKEASEGELEEEESEGEWEEEESEEDSGDLFRNISKKPFDPMTDKMFDIPSDSTEMLKQSMDNFKPEHELTKSMISADFEKVNALPGQHSISGEDLENFEQIQEIMVEQELEGKGYINVMKKLPPKIPIDRIVRKDKKNMPSIKSFSEKSKKSGGSNEESKKLTPSTEKRLSKDKETDSLEEEKEIDPFTNEQNVAMEKIILDEGLKSSSEEEKITELKTKVTSTKSKKQEEDKMDKIIEGLKGKSLSKRKGKKVTTDSDSSSSYSDDSNLKKKSKKDDSWDNMGIKFKDQNQGRQPFSDYEIREAFKVFDLNKNGYVGASEIKFILDHMDENANDEEIDEMVSMLDPTGDGQVNFKQFYRMATGQLLPPAGLEMPNPFEDDIEEEENKMGEDLDMLVQDAEKEIEKIKGMKEKNKRSSSGISSYVSSSSEEDTIKLKKKKFKNILSGGMFT